MAPGTVICFKRPWWWTCRRDESASLNCGHQRACCSSPSGGKNTSETCQLLRD